MQVKLVMNYMKALRLLPEGALDDYPDFNIVLEAAEKIIEDYIQEPVNKAVYDKDKINILADGRLASEDVS